MGTDIHLAAEVRNDEGEWEYVPGPIIDCSLCDGTGLASRYDENRKRVPAFNDDGTRKVCWYCTNNQFDDPGANLNEDDLAFYRRRYGVGPGKIRDTWFSDRNYTVFAALGNVRNGFGFAGIEPVIADHRGVPDDATSETLALLSGEHSETWCTLDEVEAYDWTQDVYDSGVISLSDYRWIDSLTEYTAAFRERMQMLREAVGDRECRLIMDFDS